MSAIYRCLIALTVIVAMVAQYIHSGFSTTNFVLAASVLIALLVFMTKRINVQSFTAFAALETFEAFEAFTQVVKLDLESVIKLKDIPNDVLTILRPHMDKVVKSVANNNDTTTQEQALVDEKFLVTNGHPEVEGDPEAVKKVTNQYKIMAQALGTIKDLYPDFYAKQMN